MSDGSGIGGQVRQVVKESVIQPVINEAKTDLEVVTQSVAGVAPVTPQQQAQKQQEDQQKILDARRKLEFYKKIEQDQTKVRTERKQKEEEYKKAIDEKMRVKQYQVTPVAQPALPGKPMREDIARTKAELRAGRGSGG